MIKYKSIFISDAHLGTVYSQSRSLLHFLQNNSANTLYLVGDFFDDHIDEKIDWNCIYSILRLIIFNELYKNIIFIPGNHDQQFKMLVGVYGKIRIAPSDIYEAYGRKYLIVHGDQFDYLNKYAPIIFKMLSSVNRAMRNFSLYIFSLKYEAILSSKLNNWLNKFLLNEKLLNSINKFLKEKNCNGLIFGHFHEPSIKIYQDVEYINCGDWLDSNTAIVDDGFSLQLVYWRE
jgi:UDP-2,3-diacylglucosamine pyrophosphatase LpxH